MRACGTKRKSNDEFKRIGAVPHDSLDGHVKATSYTSVMRFEERDLKPYAHPVTAQMLEQGKVYFSVQFADRDLLIPIVETWVYVGRNLDPKDAETHLFFQDVQSYLQGIRYASATAENATFRVALEDNTNHIFEYEHALDELLKCSLRRGELSS